MCRPRESVRISENVPNTLPELVEHNLSPRGAQETDGGLQDLLRRGRPWEAARLPDRDAGKLLPGLGGKGG